MDAGSGHRSAGPATDWKPRPWRRTYFGDLLMNGQTSLYQNPEPASLARRWFLRECGVGLGAMALGQLLGKPGRAADSAQSLTNPLAPRQSHFPGKAKRVIFLFMAGAPSHLDLFDNTPELAKFHGTLPPPA